MSGYYVISDRVDCIQEDGISGFIWCERTGPVSSYHLKTFIKGAFWPLYLVSYTKLFFDKENSVTEATSFRGSLDSDNKSTFLCSQATKNSNSSGRAYSRVIRAIFKKNRKNRIRLRQIAKEYYGHEPTKQELHQYRAESIRLAIAACIFNPEWTVEKAVFVGAKGVVPGKFKNGLDSALRQRQSNLFDSGSPQPKSDAMCKVVSEYARDVMIRRQNGVSISDVAERLGRICVKTNSCDTAAVKMVAFIAADAFEVTVYEDQLMAKIAVDHFANKWRDRCLSTNKE